MPNDPRSLTPALAERFASVALGHVTREYPNKMDHVLNGPEDVIGPARAHPIFHGSFDWHSCVHGYWLLATVYRLEPSLPVAARIRELLDRQLVAEKIAGEVAYLGQPNRGGFERPYGWAWLLMLAAELHRHESEEGKRWRAALDPLAREFSQRFQSFLPKATYPIRSGTHFNTAFAIALAHEYAVVAGDDALHVVLVDTAHQWYSNDEAIQAWEPGGDDFLSPALVEAECMRRLMSPDAFEEWFVRFLPDVADRQPATLFRPAIVSDRTDGKIGHLDGLNLSRAWCWRSLASSWAEDDPRSAVARDASERHIEASLPHVAGDYMGEHWLATYALLALTAGRHTR